VLIMIDPKNIFNIPANKIIARTSIILILGILYLNGLAENLRGSNKNPGVQLNNRISQTKENESGTNSIYNLLRTKIDSKSGDFLSAFTETISHFRLAYKGNGIDHMNINIVNLDSGGIKLGDEIGVFDSTICVGAAIISEKNIEDNSVSIPASADDGTENEPNGFKSGNKITLKLCRDNTEYTIKYQSVNNTKGIFEKWESMFALIDYMLPTGQISIGKQTEMKLYPNPFVDFLNIKLHSANPKHLNVSVWDNNGQIIRSLFEGKIRERLELIWDGKNDSGVRMVPGIYLLKANNSVRKIIITR